MQKYGEEHSRQKECQCKGPEVEACLLCSRSSKKNWNRVSEREKNKR